MEDVKTKTLNTRIDGNLPSVARQLIAENKQRRINLRQTGGGFRSDLEKTTAYLRWKADCNTVSGAIGYIATEIERERIYALYRQLFPKKWKKSAANFVNNGYNE